MNEQSAKRLLMPALVFACSLGIGLFLVQFDHSARLNERKLVLQQLLSSVVSEIERRLSYTLTSTYVLAQEVIRTHGRFENFERFAQSTLQQLDGISNLQLAPDGIIRQVYPLAGNEKALGHDILKDDARRAEAREAIDSKSLTLAGPFNLIQGGVAVIGRNPVFLPTSGDHEAEERFWGFTSALIMLDELMLSAGVESLAERGYAYRLSRIDPLTNEEVVFASDGEQGELAWQSAEVVVPRGTWTLSVGAVGNVGGKLLVALEIGIALLLALCLAAYTRRVIDEPHQLRRKVAEQTRKLRALAYHDSLTGLANRHSFFTSLESMLEEARGSGCPLAVILLDLDRFKEVNDTLGHDIGDMLLVEASRRMLGCMPESALLARLGGDEFTIIVRGEAPLEIAEDLSASIVAVIDEPFALQGRDARVSASIGIAVLGEGITSASELLKAADQAMYRVKESGRGSFCVFDARMRTDSTMRMELAADLSQALRNGELKLVYQPIVCADSGRVTKAEAQLHWEHPVRGSISPVLLDSVAESSDLNHQIGEWVFARAARQVAAWRKSFDPAFQISVNVPSTQFRDADVVQDWISVISDLDLDPTAILVEITESVLFGDDENGKNQLEELQAAGFEVALDNFGVGYSSLSYLKELNVDYLKIDRSFIQKLSVGNDDHVLCQAIIALARRFDLRVVAEGVETDQQRALLRAERCDYLQGYLYSKPIDVATFERLFLVQNLDHAA